MRGMKCPECGRHVKVLESRKRLEGQYRRFECQTGHRWSVLERKPETDPAPHNATDHPPLEE